MHNLNFFRHWRPDITLSKDRKYFTDEYWYVYFILVFYKFSKKSFDNHECLQIQPSNYSVLLVKVKTWNKLFIILSCS